MSPAYTHARGRHGNGRGKRVGVHPIPLAQGSRGVVIAAEPSTEAGQDGGPDSVPCPKGRLPAGLGGGGQRLFAAILERGGLR